MFNKNNFDTLSGFAMPSKAQFDFCLAYLEHFSNPRELYVANVVISAFMAHDAIDARDLRTVDAMMPAYVGKYEILPF